MKKKAFISALVIFLLLGLKAFAEEPLQVFTNENATLNLNNTAFAYYSDNLTTSTLFKFKLGTPSSATVIGTAQSNFFGAGDWANPEGTWNFYVVETANIPAVFRVDTATGAVTNMGSITGMLSGHSLALMEWDHTANKFYIYSRNAVASQLYTLNWSNKSLSTIGGLNTTCSGVTAGGFNRTGNFYVIDYVNNNIYKINKVTGTSTLIGPFGSGANANIDGAFDRSDWKFYCSSAGTPSVLKQLDSTFGGNIQIGSFPYNNVISMCVASAPVSNINQVSSEIPEAFSLCQNYPNPFNPNTNIRFKIKDNKNITLKIFDTQGKEVATLVNEKLHAGEYEIVFDGGNLSSGVYFYNLTSQNFSETRKMILLK